MSNEVIEKMNWYGISDGWGIIATGWECPYCDYEHDFVFYAQVDDTVLCNGCGKESIVAEEMEW